MGQTPKDELSFLKAESPGTGKHWRWLYLPTSPIPRVKTLSLSDTCTMIVPKGQEEEILNLLYLQRERIAILFLRRTLLSWQNVHTGHHDVSPSTETLGILFLPSLSSSPWLELLLLSALKDIFVELLLVYQGHWILAKTPKTPLCFESSNSKATHYILSHFYPSLSPFFFSFFNACLEQNTMFGDSLNIPPGFFFPNFVVS